jgi:4-hydroxy 2-oxovalerate aldolase
MNEILILDCTLRDGGYINNWNFGKKAIRDIIFNLERSGLDIIECGFLQDKPYNSDIALFNNVDQIAQLITPKKQGVLYVAMIALGDIEPEKIKPYDGTSIDGIRLTFHKEDWKPAKIAAEILIDKGYKVFVQPVGTTTYSDTEFLSLIEEVNKLHPYAFYLVDTLGKLYRNDLLRLFFMVENNLLPDICVGLHSHNNLQLSFSNAQELLRINVKRPIILDTSVFGMGRGAGNLPTELLAKFMNENIAPKYQVTPLLTIVDRYLNAIYARTPWGYSAPYFLASTSDCHPNYATYLMNKETLGVEDISKILNDIPEEHRGLYHEDLVERLYLEFQNHKVDDNNVYRQLSIELRGRTALLLAPGRSIQTCNKEIQDYIKKNQPVVFSVNFVPQNIPTDFLFISNLKRLEMLSPVQNEDIKIIVTSNLKDHLVGDYLCVDYANLLGEGREADNAGAMLIRMLEKCKSEINFTCRF